MNRQHTSRVITGARSRIGSVKVVAFRDSAHRTSVLTHLAGEFMHSWIQGAKEGPTDKIMREIGSIASDDIKIRSSHPITEDWEASGLSGLQMKLALDHHSEAFVIDPSHHPTTQSSSPNGEASKRRQQWGGGSMRPIRVALTATNEEDDSVFCLVLCEERLHEMMAAPHPAMSAERIWDHQAYSIVKLDCLYDDTSRLVTGITEMRQLGLADITAISGLPDPMLTSSNGMEVEKQVEGRAKDRSNYRSMVTAAAQLPGTWLFPHLHVRKAPRAAAGLLGAAPDIDVVQAKRSIHHWAMAASSDHNEEQELEQCLSPHSFQLMDGHGVISTSISMWRESVLAQIAASKKAYRKIEVNLIDSAICTAYNAGFSHTRTCLYPFPDDIDDRGSDQVISYESMAVYLFDGHGLIEDVWMLSDPLPDQREQMRKAVEPLSYKRTSVEWIP